MNRTRRSQSFSPAIQIYPILCLPFLTYIMEVQIDDVHEYLAGAQHLVSFALIFDALAPISRQGSSSECRLPIGRIDVIDYGHSS